MYLDIKFLKFNNFPFSYMCVNLRSLNYKIPNIECGPTFTCKFLFEHNKIANYSLSITSNSFKK